MPSLGRKVRIWVEWTWSLFFPADITHLRFTRTEEVDASADPGMPLPQSRTSGADNRRRSAHELMPFPPRAGAA
jgi:NADH dehydrogenase